jgi:ammonium transporter, Amt family
VATISTPTAIQTMPGSDDDDINALWVLNCAFLVFFMQAGFSMLEAGSVRMRNVQNILLKNLLDVFLVALTYWLVGFAFAHGVSVPEECADIERMNADDRESCRGRQPGNGFIGDANFALWEDDTDYVQWFFQFAFAATAATIVSGSMAERTQFRSYLIYTVLMTAWVNPVVVHWVWSTGGWLSPFRQEYTIVNVTDVNNVTREIVRLSTKPILGNVGFLDVAGEAAVHVSGGLAGLLGAVVVGPRIGRFSIEGKPRPLKSHSMVLMVLGSSVLWFGWFGFNAGSGPIANGGSKVAGRVVVTTTLSAACGGLSALALSRWRQGLVDLTMVVNGMLAGLVSITGGCALVDLWASALVGLFGGTIYFLASGLLLHRRLQIDDPLDAAPVHLFCGSWGIIAVGLFARKDFIEQVYPVEDAETHGLLLGGGFALLGSQILGLLTVVAWVSVWFTALFLSLKRLGWLRVDEESEARGLDLTYHGGRFAYDFDVDFVAEEDIEAESSVSSLTSTFADDSDTITSSTSSPSSETETRS